MHKLDASYRILKKLEAQQKPREKRVVWLDKGENPDDSPDQITVRWDWDAPDWQPAVTGN